jgi:hypothetical protein
VEAGFGEVESREMLDVSRCGGDVDRLYGEAMGVCRY